MLSNIGVNRVTGVLLIVFIPVIIFSITVVDAVDTYDTEFREVFNKIADSPTQLRIGLASTMAASMLSVLLAGALYLSLSSHHRALAVFGALGFLFAGVLWVVSGISGIALDRMAVEFNDVFNASEKASITSSAQPLAFMNESALFLALFLPFPLALIAFSSLFVRTGVAPRWLGWAGIVSSLTMATMSLSSAAGVFWVVGMIGLMLALLWLALTGVWLIIWGTRDVAGPSSPSQRAPELQPAL